MSYNTQGNKLQTVSNSCIFNSNLSHVTDQGVCYKATFAWACLGLLGMGGGIGQLTVYTVAAIPTYKKVNKKILILHYKGILRYKAIIARGP